LTKNKEQSKLSINARTGDFLEKRRSELNEIYNTIFRDEIHLTEPGYVKDLSKMWLPLAATLVDMKKTVEKKFSSTGKTCTEWRIFQRGKLMERNSDRSRRGK
jgi:hypothetical protein